MRALIFTLLALTGANVLLAQTGPGGVGNSTTVPLWLKADSGPNTLSNGQPVSQWSDKSGNNNHATQSTASQQPLFSSSLINGMPALFFDNIGGPNNDLLTIPDNDNLDNTAGLTIITVSRPISIDNNAARAIISKRTDVGNQQSYTVFYYTNNKMTIDLEGNDNRFTSATTFVASRDYIVTVLFDGSLTSASRAKVYVNENLDVTATETGAAISNNASPVTIGTMNLNDGRPFGGYIAEIIVIRKALNVAERLIAHNYLFAKYGITSTSIPASINDLYVGDDPANGNYDYEVGGVGRDASGSSGLVSSFVTGGLDVTTVSGYDIGDYLLFGHQAGTNAVQISDVGGMTGTNNARWSRVWFVDVTNTSTNQAVNIQFDLSDAGTPGTPTTASNYVLLYRAGQTGNWTEVATGSGISGDRISFNNIAMTADGYYTLGSKNLAASPLPIVLLDFSGEFTEKGVELTWTTSHETNNDHYTIQRSANGEEFTDMTIVKAGGNSIEEITYNAFDPAPFADRTYYRLLQTDFDGTITNLKTIVVRTAGRPGSVEVIPNPSNGNFYFELPEGVVSADLKIFDSAGAPVAFSHSSMGSRVTVDAQTLPKGLYILKLVSDRGMYAAKFVVE